ncbi:MAG: DUF4870 domain-containing protein [Kaiparowitsia implicata GSE-PSE-MK54-09C]|jgi:uncharacterized Tic20 family protein|nr:DUF4870 domain-containing protein [Kaiparowitsia implicata GSE-PSE-MK54-09C]
MNPDERRKLLAVLCHVSQLFSSIAITIAVPIVILVISDDPIVQAHAKEAINFAINILLYLIASVLLFFFVVGIPLTALVIIASWRLPIFATVRAAIMPNLPYRYPFILRFV